MFLVFQLISGGNSGSLDNADSSVVVQEACEYYRINQDFTLEHQIALNKLYPHLKTVKELTGLCHDDVSLFLRPAIPQTVLFISERQKLYTSVRSLP